MVTKSWGIRIRCSGHYSQVTPHRAVSHQGRAFRSFTHARRLRRQRLPPILDRGLGSRICLRAASQEHSGHQDEYRDPTRSRKAESTHASPPSIFQTSRTVTYRFPGLPYSPLHPAVSNPTRDRILPRSHYYDNRNSLRPRSVIHPAVFHCIRTAATLRTHDPCFIHTGDHRVSISALTDTRRSFQACRPSSVEVDLMSGVSRFPSRGSPSMRPLLQIPKAETPSVQR